MGNFPDDIRMYDDDPRSPFYVEPTYPCNSCGEYNEACDMYDEGVCWVCHSSQEEEE